MENQDHRAPISSGHGVYLCSKCGWPFPNPHPSAKHRRAHKKVCGTIDGYKVIQPELTPLAISEEEEPLSDEGRTPSPKIEGKSLKEVAGSCQSATRSEDEHFSDAMAEFSDSGLSPGMDEGSEVARKLVRDVEKFEEEGDGLLKVDATIVDDPSRTLQIGDLQQVESEMKSPDVSILLGSTSKESTIGLDETKGQQLESTESKTLAVLTVEDEKETTDNAPLSDDRHLDICAKEIEHANIVDAPVDEVLQEGDKENSSLSKNVCRNLEVGEESDDFLQDSTTRMHGMSTDDKNQYESVGDKDVHMLSVVEGISSLNYSQDHKDHGSLKSSIALGMDTSIELLSSTEDEDKTTLEGNDQFVMDAGKPGQQLVGPPTILDALGDDITKDGGEVLADGKNDMGGSELINDEHFESYGLVSATATPESPALTMEPTISLSMEDKSSESHLSEDVRQSIPTILDAKADDIKNPIEESSHSYGSKVINDEIFGSCGSGPATSTLESPISNFEPANSLPMEDESSQCKPLGGSDDNSSAPHVCEEDNIISKGSEIIYDCGIDKTKMSFSAENESSDVFLQDSTTMHDMGTEDKSQYEFVGDKDVHMLSVDESISSINYSQDHKDWGSLKSTIALDMDTSIEPLSSTQDDDKSILEDNDQFIMDACEPDQHLLGPPTILDASGDEIRKDGDKVLAEGENDMGGSEVINNEQLESYGLVSATGTPESPALTMEPTVSLALTMEPTVSLSMEDESSESHLREEVTQSIPTILDAKADDIKNPIEESFHSYGSMVIKDEHFGSCGSGPATSTLEPQILNFEPTNSLPMEDESLQCKPLDGSDDNSTAPRVCEEDKQAIISGGSEIIYECGIDKTKLTSTAESESSKDYLPDQCSADTQIAGSEHREKVAANDDMGNTEPMHDSSTAVVESTSADEIDERKDGSVIEASSIPRDRDMNLGNNDVVVDAKRALEVSSLPPVKKGEDDDDKTGKQQDGGATVVDKSVASSSRTDSLEANWGSVSESTLHVDGGAQEKPSLQETTLQAERDPHTFDDIVDQNVHKDPSDEAAAAMKAAVGNEESQQGRTKNEEERIAKVTNWKQQHTPLKNLLGEAKSPKKDETATASSKVTTTTVNSILMSEEGQKEVDKEWDSPARYRPSVDIKKERKKGKTYWVPFACCSSSVH
ncbi:hypothetical protein DM860_005678 [Cuscuta australis]|uniref:C2H2-type domain-containing protein n=1 Tax=Cuscuta australis TaxID=267555 RepID=A0A328DRJ5_9ASTE|nr:hypothetical protein DM860_005678 [Cuscuta australis]